MGADDTRERILSRVTADWETGCWLWNGTATGTRYAMIRHNGRVLSVHRLAYTLWVGDIPDGLCVLHDCDTPRCVNPAHLSLGTQADNMAAMARRNRAARGETHTHAKLNARSVLDIRRRYAAGGVTQRALAAEYGVSCANINRTLLGIQWRHVSTTQ